MRRLRVHDIAYVGAALAVALLVQRADLARPGRDVATPAVALRPLQGEPEESFRLAPDRRVLMAVEDLQRLATGSAARAEARFDGERWVVTCDGAGVGMLSELPSYPEILGLLEGWARQLRLDSLLAAPGISGDPAPLQAELDQLRALRAAQLADLRWSVGERGATLFELGARAVVHLALGVTDQVEASDRLVARALALVAACEISDPGALARESCALSERMGYGADARAAGQRFSPYDPVRAFVEGDDARLAALATGRRAPAESRLLARARAAAVPSPMAALLAFEDDLAALGALASSEGARALTATTGEEAPLAAVVEEFERLLAAARTSEGPFLDPEVLAGYWRGNFYTAVRAAIEPAPGTKAAADPLAGVHRAAGAELAGWARHVAAGGATPAGRVALTTDLGALPHFGAPLRCEAFDALSGGAPVRGPAIRRAAQRLVACLDTRPAHRARLGRLAGRELLALPLAQDLLESAAAAGAPMDCELEAWWAGRTRDRARLEAMLARAGLTVTERAIVLDAYAALPGADGATVGRAYRSAIADHPQAWPLVAGYTRTLERQRAFGPARAGLHAWLERNADRAGLDAIAARTLLARLYEDQRLYAQGFATIASVVASQQPEAMACAVRLLDAMGQASQAETLAVFAAERADAPLPALAQALDLFWRHGRPEAAARLAATRPPAAIEAWRDPLGGGFARCFARDVAAGRVAAESLLAVGRVPDEALSQIAAAAADSGAWALAFEVESRAQFGPGRRIEQLVSLCRYLTGARGEEQAIAWLAPRLKGVRPAGLAELERRAFAAGADRLLWSVRPDSTAEYPWLLRAAAALRRGDHGGEHARDLAWHFAAPDRSHDRTLGRFLLGLEDESSVANLGETADERCVSCYFLGFKAQSEGRTRAAAEWFTRCLGTRAADRAEYGWAWEQLDAWRRLGVGMGRGPEPARTPA